MVQNSKFGMKWLIRPSNIEIIDEFLTEGDVL